jgi:hypothetical protein
MRAKALTRPIVFGAIAAGLLLGTVLVAGYVARPGNEATRCEVKAGQCQGKTSGCCGDVGPAECCASGSAGEACAAGIPKPCCEKGAPATDNPKACCPSCDVKPCCAAEGDGADACPPECAKPCCSGHTEAAEQGCSGCGGTK